MMDWQWHQLDHMQTICTLLQTGRMLFLTPSQRPVKACCGYIGLGRPIYNFAYVTDVLECDKKPLLFLHVQLDNLELKLAESRRRNHDRRSALQQVEKTIETDAARVQDTLAEQLRLQRQLEMSLNTASQFQRSLSFDSECRAKRKYSHRTANTMQDK